MLTEVGQETLSKMPRMESVRRSLLEKALGFYEKLLVEESDDPAVRMEAARAYRRAGDIRRLLGQHDRACEAIRSSIDVLNGLLASRPSDFDCRRELAESHGSLGGSLSKLGQTAEAESEYRWAIELRRDIVERSSGDPDDRLGSAIAQGKLGTFLYFSGRLDDARKTLRPARDILERLVADFPNNPQYQNLLGGILNDSALPELDQGKLTEARSLLQQADAHQQAALKLDPRNPRFRIFARNHQEMLSLTLIQLGQRNEAEKILRQCISIGEGIASDFPLVPGYREDLAGSYGNLATLLIGMGPDRREDASRAFDQAGRLFQGLAAEYPDIPTYRKNLASLRMNLGHLLRDARRWKDAERAYHGAVEIGEVLLAGEPTNLAFKQALANEKDNLARLLVNHPDTPVYDPSRAARQSQEATELAPEKPSFWAVLSLAHYRMGEWKASVAAMENAIKRGDAAKVDPVSQLLMAMARWRLGEKDAARVLFKEVAPKVAQIKSQDETICWIRAEAAALFGPIDRNKLEDKETKRAK